MQILIIMFETSSTIFGLPHLCSKNKIGIFSVSNTYLSKTSIPIYLMSNIVTKRQKECIVSRKNPKRYQKKKKERKNPKVRILPFLRIYVFFYSFLRIYVFFFFDNQEYMSPKEHTPHCIIGFSFRYLLSCLPMVFCSVLGVYNM